MDQQDLSGACQQAIKTSDQLKIRIDQHPEKFRILTGERPTGPLHIGHYFGTLQNRLILQKKGVELWIVIADYQVLTDRDAGSSIRENVIEVMADYLSIGIDPTCQGTTIFAHSCVRALNQLLIPFLSLVPSGDLERNPTVKNEIQLAGLKSVNGLMYTYPVHQAADILFCHGNLVPGGMDQLPHIEQAREIARRFNDRYAKKGKPYFQEPHILLSEAPLLLGLDGRKMSKSLNNSIALRDSADQTARLIKKAKTDSDRNITYDPTGRPDVANLLLITSLCSGQKPEAVAAQIGDGGAGKLKAVMTEAVNEYFAPVRAKRLELITDKQYLLEQLAIGNQKANVVAERTLIAVQKMLGMDLG
ncbi:MAG: tryptophan--tRNA ligase [Bdellovibrionales bacterium]|jgi:tryptophanyl-tRNA synthetase|nr:tryptophan--tRNA ligase [Bdellovibrionales bacterium]MBT3525135.1 tryptophan--tRNA ligase [Bdellovibrionales bacterium]MBT7668862.1 tryptophan--tRNA ligase [Bdellovibrionales bacterium]MBT7767106.1 tryptophan--tRNA ligase [Bdellovibrionales bacterium]